MNSTRRDWLRAALGPAVLLPLAASFTARASAASDTERKALAAALREGACAIAFRHALAPGTFDPPGFDLADCKTQRNLNDEGRAQARRIGAWFRDAGLVPAAVRSSPWCRCIDTATLAFGRAEPWAGLGSPVRSDQAAREQQVAELRRALAALASQRGRFEAWVTHQFVLQNLAGASLGSGDALLLKADASGSGGVQVLARASLY